MINERGEIADITLTRSHVDTRFNLRGSQRRSPTLNNNNLRLVVMWILDSTGDFLEGGIFDRKGSIGC